MKTTANKFVGSLNVLLKRKKGKSFINFWCLLFSVLFFPASSILGLIFLREKSKPKDFASKFCLRVGTEDGTQMQITWHLLH